MLPGPSAVETALVASGLAGEQYRFVGLPPPLASGERAALWDELARLAASDGRVRVAEAPAGARSRASPRAEPDRPRRRLPRADEGLRGGRLRDRRRARRALRGAAEGRDHARDRAVHARRPTPAAAVAAVVELVAAGAPRRVAASVVARLTGVPRNALYERLAVGFFDNVRARTV